MAPWLTLVLGIAVLLLGAELLVRGAVRLSLLFGLAPLVVGLTVVAFGTSAPELAVSVAAAGRGAAELALANVLGSNVFNVLLVLGATALVRPLVIQRRVVRREVPLVIVASALVWWMAGGGGVTRLDAGLLLIALVFYVTWSIREGLRAEVPEPDLSRLPALGEVPEPADHGARRALRRYALPAGLVALGLAGLAAGSSWLVESARVLARSLGVGEAVVGLTVVAVGTSLPEVATSVVAAFRGEQDLAVGNVLGSNLFNLLGILGVAGLLDRSGLAVSGRMLTFDLPIMLIAAVVCLPIFVTDHRIDRGEGGLLVVFYVGYLACLVAAAAGRLTVGGSLALWGFVAPLTLFVAVTVALRARRARRPGDG